MSIRRVPDDYNDNDVTWRPWEMASGDAQRTWFPEMVVRLRAEWHEGMSIPALIALRDELDGTLHRIRTGRNIKTPIITCCRCGRTGPAAEPHVSVRALILALARFEIASKDQTRAGKRVGSIPQATPAGRRRKSPSRGPGKMLALKIASRVPRPKLAGEPGPSSCQRQPTQRQ